MHAVYENIKRVFVLVYRIYMTFAAIITSTEAFREIKLYQVYRKVFTWLKYNPLVTFLFGWIWRVKWNCSLNILYLDPIFLLSLASFFRKRLRGLHILILNISYHPIPSPSAPTHKLSKGECLSKISVKYFDNINVRIPQKA